MSISGAVNTQLLNTQLIDGLVAAILALSSEEQRVLLERVEAARTRHVVETKLKAYELQYGMKSEAFHTQFLTGALGDSEDYMEWAGFYEMLHGS